MKAFCFDPEIAMVYGVDAAVMLWNLDHWIQKNKANGRHFHDGFYWTYNTAQAFTELFPFWTAKQITRILAKLEDAGVLHTGNYNPIKYDRTKWYAIDYDVLLREKAFFNLDNCILPNGQMDLPAIKNGNAQTGEPIPNINTDINTDNKQIEVETRGARTQQIIPQKQKRVSRNKSFEDSEIARWEDFEKTFGTDEYAGADIRHYYETIKDWATAKGAKYIDWIAFVRNWMRRDFKDGKLVRVGGFDSLEQWKKDMILRDRANDAEELWPDL